MKYATHQGLQNLIERAKKLERRVSQTQMQVGEATSQGAESWHDNSVYDSIVYDLQVQNRDLSNLHDLINKITIKEYPEKGVILPKVVYGSLVIFNSDGVEESFSIVGYGDEDITKDRINYETPLAGELLSKKVGDFWVSRLGNKNCFLSEIYGLGRLD
ncbi:MAG: GreA/GreB family elongation factor [Candidatus Woesearchaeota archaeon]